ncbi:hypothetical protein GWK08_03225 [Leptobacterium flavescens]|uniref:Carboxypeptidase-like regulatory domain-containing protein n=1 Tax=Leptobacterium flavescens TaxID=472055 RepID=A0A6P0UKP3_9FLAO|nr:carboxypeptidase-like regulatory domain-containing protein [Leptobacterium flavescens]NER12439.1 hypothetical protein [Leptobacterium flavescens]
MRQLLLAILCFPLFLQGQDQKVLIDGKILNTSPDLEGIHVLNITALTGTITKKDGSFQIFGKLGDTLVISSVQYETHRIPLNEEIIRKKSLEVLLYAKVNKLDEVVVKPHNLSGNLSRDLGNVETEGKVVRPSRLGLPNIYVKPKTQTERRLYEAKSGGGILPLNPIINAISGRTKRLKQQLAIERKEKELTKTKEEFNPTIYSEYLKIPEDRLDDFIYFCAVDDTFVILQQRDDSILMLEYLRKKSEEYRQINKLD